MQRWWGIVTHYALRITHLFPPPIPLLPPRVAVHVVAALLPEAGGVGGAELDGAEPFGTFPEVESWDEAAQRIAVLGGEIFAFPLVGEEAVVSDELGQRHVHRESG